MKYSIIMLMLAVVSVASAADDSTPDGVLSLTPVEESSYIAVRIELPDSTPIGGVRWYNNDGGTVFPSILLTACNESGEPDYSISLPIGANVAGNHMDWSDLVLDTPILNDVGDLFAVFQLPPYSMIAAPGSGPGIGYKVSQDPAPPVFISHDGHDWVKIGDDVKLEYETIQAVSKAGGESILFQRPEAPTFVTALNQPMPNPFNPSTSLSFSLANKGRASLSIYNVRGQLVRTLVHEWLDAGLHEAVWHGDDDSGARVSSGVYFARLVAGQTRLSQRLVLLK